MRSRYAWQMEDYDLAYRKSPDLFGECAEEILLDFEPRFPRHALMLDIGCGTGRNSLAAAARAHRVLGIDPSAQALEILQARSEASGHLIETHQCSFDEFHPPVQSFDVICIFGLLQMLDPAGILRLLGKIDSWSHAGSFLLLVAWNTGDPKFGHLSECRQEIPSRGLPLRSFRSSDGAIRSFFLPGRLPEIFPGWENIHHEEKLGPWHRHGDSEPERHGRIEYVARREK